MEVGWLLINGGFWPLCKPLLTCIGAEETFMQSLSSFFVFLSVLKFSWPVLSYLDYSFDLPSYVSDSTKRYTLLLLICLEAREGRFGSYSAWAEMTFLWRLPGMTGGRMKRCKIYFGHWTPGFFFREIAWWVKCHFNFGNILGRNFWILITAGEILGI